MSLKFFFAVLYNVLVAFISVLFGVFMAHNTAFDKYVATHFNSRKTAYAVVIAGYVILVMIMSVFLSFALYLS